MTWKAMEDKISVFCRCNPFITSHMQIIPQSTKASLARNKVIKTSQTSPITRLDNIDCCSPWLYQASVLSVHESFKRHLSRLPSRRCCHCFDLFVIRAEYKSWLMTHIEKYAGLSVLMVRYNSLCLTVQKISQSSPLPCTLVSQCLNTNDINIFRLHHGHEY